MNTSTTPGDGDDDLGLPTGIVGKIRSLGQTVADQAGSIVGSGVAAVSNRRDDRIRDQLLRDLGRQHLAMIAGSADTDEIDRLVSEIQELDDSQSTGPAGDEEE